MSAGLDRPRIKTDNELYGSGFLASDEGGAWLVCNAKGIALCVCANREAASAALYDKAESAKLDPSQFTISVFHIHETWPGEEETESWVGSVVAGGVVAAAPGISQGKESSMETRELVVGSVQFHGNNLIMVHLVSEIVAHDEDGPPLGALGYYNYSNARDAVSLVVPLEQASQWHVGKRVRHTFQSL